MYLNEVTVLLFESCFWKLWLFNFLPLLFLHIPWTFSYHFKICLPMVLFICESANSIGSLHRRKGKGPLATINMEHRHWDRTEKKRKEKKKDTCKFILLTKSALVAGNKFLLRLISSCLYSLVFCPFIGQQCIFHLRFYSFRGIWVTRFFCRYSIVFGFNLNFLFIS